MKILCDQMLGSLAKWLRLLGIDTYFSNEKITDDELLDIAKSENRIMFTRDKELIIRARKNKISCVQIETTDLDEQLNIVLKEIKFDEDKILTRCNICNETLKKVDKRFAEGNVPKRIFENKNDFWYCKKCNKFYWKGSHYEKILEKIFEIKAS